MTHETNIKINKDTSTLTIQRAQEHVDVNADVDGINYPKTKYTA